MRINSKSISNNWSLERYSIFCCEAFWNEPADLPTARYVIGQMTTNGSTTLISNCAFENESELSTMFSWWLIWFDTILVFHSSTTTSMVSDVVLWPTKPNPTLPTNSKTLKTTRINLLFG
ncbi:unnamed protein product [Caenorhabditis angaria]|uniref:Uncharacterized protein n=1 Tax=Caenorhabditis angaria TaxID=860376 RepID=A0A9P1N0F5_9PELO|nr:unnamed protein product [Caenorhabditis angaria]